MRIGIQEDDQPFEDDDRGYVEFAIDQVEKGTKPYIKECQYECKFSVLGCPSFLPCSNRADSTYVVTTYALEQCTAPNKQDCGDRISAGGRYCKCRVPIPTPGAENTGEVLHGIEFSAHCHEGVANCNAGDTKYVIRVTPSGTGAVNSWELF